MTVNSIPFVTGVKYSLGSTWVQLKPGQDTFHVVDAAGSPTLATVTGTPPLSPSAATVFLYGTKVYGLAAKLLNDAPEVYGSGAPRKLRSDDADAKTAVPKPPRVLIFSLGDDYGFVSLALRSRPAACCCAAAA